METITGIVISVTPTRGQKADFMIRVDGKGDFRVQLDYLLLVQEDDVIYGEGKIDGRNIIFPTKPFATIPVGEEQVKRSFIRALRGSGFGEISAQRLYTQICDIIKSVKQVTSVRSEDVISYLTDISSKYDKTYSEHILGIFTNGTTLTDKQAGALLRWWNKSRSVRRLYLLGLTNGEITACTEIVQALATMHNNKIKDLDAIYDQCIINPFALAPIPLEKASTISRMVKKEPQFDQLACGKIIRTIYEMSVRNAWTCTPLRILQKHHSDLSQFA